MFLIAATVLTLPFHDNRVLPYHGIVTNETQAFYSCLRDQDPIERVTMDLRQSAYLIYMGSLNRQQAYTIGFLLTSHQLLDRRSQLDLAKLLLNLDLP
jgi:hypothetical protein